MSIVGGKPDSVPFPAMSALVPIGVASKSVNFSEIESPLHRAFGMRVTLACREADFPFEDRKICYKLNRSAGKKSSLGAHHGQRPRRSRRRLWLGSALSGAFHED